MIPAVVDLVRAALETPSHFYRDRLGAAGITRATDLDAAAWNRLAPTNRAELIADQLANPPFGSRRREDAPAPIRAGATGTGDDLLVLTWTSSDLAHEREAGVRSLQALGIEPGMRVANALPGALTTPGSLLLGDVVDDLGALDVPLGAVRDDAGAKAAWKLIDRVEPDVLIVDTPGAAALFADAPVLRRPWWKGVVTLLSDTGSTTLPHEVPETLEFAGWNRYWLAVPDAASFVAASCGAGSLHVDAGVFLEILDEDSQPAERGYSGRVVVTPLAREQVLLRYRSGVRAREVDCACGNPGTAIRVE